MKVDKDTLIKHRFWIVLGVAVGLNLIGWLLLLVTVPSTLGKTEADVVKKWNDGKKFTNPVNPEDVKQAAKDAEARMAEQGSSHDGLYKRQSQDASVTGWPQQLEASVRNGKYASEIVIHPKKGADKLPKSDAKRFVGMLTDKTDPSGTYFIVESREDKAKSEVKFFTTDETKYSEMGKDGKDKKLEARDLSGKDMIGRPVVITYYQGKYFGEKLTRAEYDAFAKYYDSQLPALFTTLGAVNALGEPVVQFRYVKGGVASGTGPGGIKVGKGKLKGGGPATMPTPEVKVDPEAEEALAKYQVGDTWMYDASIYNNESFTAQDKWNRNRPPSDNRFLPYVPKWEFKDLGAEDIAEEIWIAQENLWVERELYKRIKQANDSVAAFLPNLNAKESQGDGKTKPVKLKNYYWEIELKGAAGDDTVEIVMKNLRPVRQELFKQRFWLLVERADGKKTKVDKVLFPPKGKTFSGVPLGPLGFKGDKIKDTSDVQSIQLGDGIRLEGKIVGAEQVLTWETAAVKRIDLIAIGGSPIGDAVVSHRLSNRLLVPYRKIEEKKDDSAVPTKPVVVKKGGPGGKALQPLQEYNTTTHGFVRERYLEVTAQARKLAVCMVLIVDPDHMGHVEAAFLDSPLRILITAVMWQRYAGSLRPPDLPGKTDAPPPPPMPPAPGSPTDTTAGGDEQENIELALYAVITIYERPGRPQAGAAPETPATPSPAEKKSGSDR